MLQVGRPQGWPRAQPPSAGPQAPRTNRWTPAHTTRAGCHTAAAVRSEFLLQRYITAVNRRIVEAAVGSVASTPVVFCGGGKLVPGASAGSVPEALQGQMCALPSRPRAQPRASPAPAA